MAKIGDSKVVYGKQRKLYAVAVNPVDAGRDKRILGRRGYQGIVTVKRKGYQMINGRRLKVTLHEIWAIKS